MNAALVAALVARVQGERAAFAFLLLRTTTPAAAATLTNAIVPTNHFMSLLSSPTALGRVTVPILGPTPDSALFFPDGERDYYLKKWLPGGHSR